MLPAELNETSDNDLFALVDGVVIEGDQNAENRPPLAPFVTLEVLRRVHERVVELKKSGMTNATKHKSLARAVLRLIGMRIPPDDRDVDKIGNHLDVWLSRRYIQVDKKICKNTRNPATRAEKKAALMTQCCIINGWGGVSEHIPLPASDVASPPMQQTVPPRASRAPHVPFTQSYYLPPNMSVHELREELNQARSDARSASADLHREKERCNNAKRRYEVAITESDAALKLVELANIEKMQASKEAEKKVKLLTSQMRTENARQQRESAQALKVAEAKVLRLGSQVAAAAQEAAMHAQREERLRTQLEQEQEKANALVEQLRAEMAALIDQRSRLQRESAQALKDAQAKVLRLGSQAAAAAHEAALHAHREEALRCRLENEQENAEKEAQGLRNQMARLRNDGVKAQREWASALKEAEAKVLRLGSQAAAAAQEAAAHALKEEKLRLLLEEEQERAEAKTEELRAQMAILRSDGMRAQRESARALRDAEAKVLRLGSQAAAAAQEAAAHALREEHARQREEDVAAELREALSTQEYFRLKAEVEAKTRRELAKQCTATQAARNAVKATSQKRLQLKHELIAQVENLKAELEAAHEQLDVLNERVKAHADATSKLGQMPTWERKRKADGSVGAKNRTGKRGGGLKLEHAHRLAILEQHANGTPASAIGHNIVSVVKKAAPWLNPVQPTVREIRQMGFELTTLEEALSARRCASAFKVRLLGFDETTDLHQPVLTSNVQIQDTPDGQVQDLVLKAAYLATQGATSEAVAHEIEEMCFARLRGLLVSWHAHHQRMFPDLSWTGPDVQLCSLHRLAGGGALMSDTCNAARKTKRLLAEFIGRQAEAAYRRDQGDEAWESLSQEQRENETQVYQLDCHQHLRNIWLGHMSKRQVRRAALSTRHT